MLSLEEAQARVITMARRTPIESVPVAEALGRYCAEDILAARTQPAADLSAMDGYAIGGEEQGPWQIVGESRAGTPYDGALKAGEAARISTGAVMPQGSDRVLIQENAGREGDALVCLEDYPGAGRHIRKRGFDFAEGDLAISAGVRLNPAHLALALGAGHGALRTHRPPGIALLDSGDELAADPQQCGPHQIPASNGAMLAAMFARLGCPVRRLGPVIDDHTALAEALGKADGDILVTTGGASVGDHDLIRPALEAWGAQLDFWKVAIKPGKPMMVAQRDGQVIVGLPGNPVSSYVTAVLFVLPLIRAAMGSNAPLPRIASLELGTDLPPVGSRREFVRAYWDGNTIAPVGDQDSGALFALAQANALIDRPAHSGETKAGTYVPVILLENG